MWLYEKLDAYRNDGFIKEVPQYVKDNLNQSFQVRSYQQEAIENFITHFESKNVAGKNVHTLFHMATGSGKTFIMSGLIIYLYKQGYRNFLFFVNLSQIVKKTEDNFLNPASSKYLFANEIKIDGKSIHVNKVNNFQECNPNDINILFTTTAGLHSDMTLIKENSVSIDDFLTDKTVLIADEAHHLNTATTSSEKENEHSWETTVNKIKNSNVENVMLEFTATCDITNPDIARKYQDKIIFNYDLAKFRKDKYSKDIYTLRSDFEQTEDGRLYRSLQAMILSQYKLKLFQDMKKNVKPVILFKSKTIKESENNKLLILDFIRKLTVENINYVKISSASSELIQTVFAYFEKNNITDEALVDEIKLAFTEDVCIDVNDDKDAEEKQIIVNSLEDESNPYRIIFEVEKLDEGWDCLNLFDIVRLYETRDSRGDKPGRSTVREAQLIGRGARYYPFEYKDRDKYKRKFDSEDTNPFRVCEQLHYHCQNNSRYINELNNALHDIGIDDTDDSKKIHIHNNLKDNFLKSDLFKFGFVFLNKQENKKFSKISDIQEIQNEYSYNLTSVGAEDTRLLDDENKKENHKNKALEYVVIKTFGQLCKEISYNFIYFELSKHNVFTFDNVKSLFPDVTSLKEFVTDEKYLGQILISITSNHENPSLKEWIFAVRNTVNTIATQLSVERKTMNGSKEFEPKLLSEAFDAKGTDRNYTLGETDGDGIPQTNCIDNSLKCDLENMDWYVYSDNYGTTEEKRFVRYFHDYYVPDLEKKYSEIKLIRNECQVKIFDFTNGNAFEPDYLLFLKNQDSGEYEYTQVFIEPKGKDHLEKDSWKEDFLLQLESQSVSVVHFKTDSKYKIWGLHFFSHGERDKMFEADIKKLCE